MLLPLKIAWVKTSPVESGELNTRLGGRLLVKAEVFQLGFRHSCNRCRYSSRDGRGRDDAGRAR
jgi:hypothetical protein